jgi:hypothetical protein
MIVLPRFFYRLLEHRFARTIAYVLLFASVFAFIVWYLVHLENAPV